MAAEEYITRGEHDEFCRRLEEQDKRQDKRIGIIEEDVKEFRALQTAIEKLAVNMENMLKEQVKQGKRLETLERQDGENWRKAMGYAMTAAVGALVGFLLKQVGIF